MVRNCILLAPERTTVTDFMLPEYPFCGIGLKSNYHNDADPEVMPISIWRAEPNQEYQISPQHSFTILAGERDIDSKISVEELGQMCFIDFTQRKEKSATVLYGGHGDFSMEYS